MSWTYSSREDQEYNNLYGDPTKSSKTMRHYKQFLLDSAVERKMAYSGGYYNPNRIREYGDPHNTKITGHTPGKYYKLTSQHVGIQGGKADWYVGESKIDYINHRVKELSKGMKHSGSGKGGG